MTALGTLISELDNYYLMHELIIIMNHYIYYMYMKRKSKKIIKNIKVFKILISRMYPCLNDILEKINELMIININLLNQTVGIYNEENLDYKFHNFVMAFYY